MQNFLTHVVENLYPIPVEEWEAVLNDSVKNELLVKVAPGTELSDNGATFNAIAKFKQMFMQLSPSFRCNFIIIQNFELPADVGKKTNNTSIKMKRAVVALDLDSYDDESLNALKIVYTHLAKDFNRCKNVLFTLTTPPVTLNNVTEVANKYLVMLTKPDEEEGFNLHIYTKSGHSDSYNILKNSLGPLKYLKAVRNITYYDNVKRFNENAKSKHFVVPDEVTVVMNILAAAMYLDKLIPSENCKYCSIPLAHVHKVDSKCYCCSNLEAELLKSL